MAGSAHGVDDMPDRVLNSSKGRQSLALQPDEWLKVASGEKSVVGDNPILRGRRAFVAEGLHGVDKFNGPEVGVISTAQPTT